MDLYGVYFGNITKPNQTSSQSGARPDTGFMKNLKKNRLRQLVLWGYITQPQANQL